MTKQQVIKYLKNKIYKLNQEYKDDYADKNYIRWAIQTIENTIEIIRG